MERMIAALLAAVIAQPLDVAEWNSGRRQRLAAGEMLSIQVPASWTIDAAQSRATSQTAMLRLLVSEQTIEWSVHRNIEDEKRILPDALTRYVPQGVVSERRFLDLGGKPMIVQDYSQEGVHGRVACVLTGNRIGVINVVYDEPRAAELSEFVDAMLRTTDARREEAAPRSGLMPYFIGGGLVLLAFVVFLAIRKHRSAALHNDRNLKRVRR
jgi:hypothetical protein